MNWVYLVFSLGMDSGQIGKFEKMRKNGRKGVFASLFGVGAPEALVIGVVALLVFGPKGLAEVLALVLGPSNFLKGVRNTSMYPEIVVPIAKIAKNLGKTLRTFQPTIRELQAMHTTINVDVKEVSREFKSTLEKEIGLDELKNPSQFNTATIPTLSSTPLSVLFKTLQLAQKLEPWFETQDRIEL
ncbi:sec-independent protein translocase protein TATB, chloroplastic [Artemisia annua]|uniref:Sec-independent protein translocase protein TATB, chloroplastic n=1 Tax=Artemisia annua TaxID=35608 RepID=A0A2U1LD28_ARTAN|nr:sec-independent protein translocase protein TATB, chloroplastic [Artemisia annua]